MAKPTISELENIYKNLKGIVEAQEGTLTNLFEKERSRAQQTQLIAERQKLISELLKLDEKTLENHKSLLNELLREQDDAVTNEKKLNDQLARGVKRRQNLVDHAKNLGTQIMVGYKYLIEQDKVIKSTIISLGLSGGKAAIMRDAMGKSLFYAEGLGAGIEGIAQVMQGYADETGKARVLSSEMVKDVIDIGKGTGLGVEQAARLGGQFELMGLDARSTNEFVQGIVDTTERMGINTTKVLKNVNTNFRKLNMYNFQQGTKGIAEMAAHAERFKVDITQSMNAIDKAKSLEGAIDMVAQLQVMGGEFAKMDMHQTLYLARNDAKQFNEQLSIMTKGLVSYRKVTDNKGETIFETFISPADRDRIQGVAKAWGMTAESVTEMAQRRLEFDTMSQQMSGSALTNIQKEWVKGAAIFNSETKKFQVTIAGNQTNIAELTDKQAKAFVGEQKLLRDRAKELLTFDEAFKNTINQLKSGLIPLLTGINKTLGWLQGSVFTDLIKRLTSGSLGWLKAGGTLLAASAGLKFASMYMNKSMGNFIQHKSLFQPKGGAAASNSFSGGRRHSRSGTASSAKGAGMGKGALGIGAGIGAAALGVGAGIGLAATGISLLADSMSKLDKEKTEILKDIVTNLGWFVLGGAGLAALIIGLGAAGVISAPGLFALGGGALMVGAGIGIAATGIGAMAIGLGTMIEKSKGAGDAMLNIGLGVGALSLAMVGFTAGGFGLAVFATTLSTIAKHSDNLTKVGDAFREINTVMSGSADDFIAVQNAVESISKVNTSGGGMLAELANLLKSPLKVEFANKEMMIRNNVTLDIDGYEFTTKVIDVPALVHKMDYLPKGRP